MCSWDLPDMSTRPQARAYISGKSLLPMLHMYITSTHMYICTSSDTDPSSIVVCCTILLGILTCGTSVLFWWLYKKCCGSKERYNVEGTYLCTYLSTCTSSYVYVSMSPDFENRPSYMHIRR